MTDHEFNEALDGIIRSTRKILQDQGPDEFSTTTFVSTDDELRIATLLPTEDTDADPYSVLYEFGKKIGRPAKKIEAVFIAAQAMAEGDRECIVVTGYTVDGRANACQMWFSRDQDGRIDEVNVDITYCSDAARVVSLSRNPAVELMKGIQAAG